MPVFTIKTPRGDEVDIDAPDEATAVHGAQRWDHEDFATSEAHKAGVDPSLALRVMQKESSGNPDATSPKGAHGLMQLMPGTAKDMGVSDPSDPYQNISGGVRYLKQQLDTFGGDQAKALAAYNAGPGAVRKYGGVPPYAETQAYVDDLTRPQEIAASHNRGVTIDVIPRKPVAIPMKDGAPPPQVSQQLGFERGIQAPAAHIGNWLESGAQKLGMDTGPIQQIAARLQAAQAAADAKEPWRKTAIPGKAGEFAGNIAGTVMLPGGPMLNGALTGAALSDKRDVGGVAGDALLGLAGGKIGASVMGGLGKAVSGVTDPAVKLLASKGVPLTLGQMGGGIAKGVEDRLSGVPIVGDVIRNAQRRGIEGANRAAFNDTLAHVNEQLPDGVDIGHDAYAYTKQRLGDLYDEVLDPLTVTRDAPFSQALSAAKAKIAKIGDPAVRANALGIIKSEVQSRFDKAGNMIGRDLKDAQSDLGAHVDSLLTDRSPTKAWNRKAGLAIQEVKDAVEGLVARTDASAGDMLAQVNKAYAHLKPLETATSKAGVKTAGVWNMNQLAQGVTKGRAASTVAAGNAPHQELASAAAKVLPSSVPDSGTAGRLLTTVGLGGLLGGHLPVIGPAALPTAGLVGGLATLYTRGGQKALTGMLTSRDPAVRAIGEHLRLLANPAGKAGAVALSSAAQ